MAEWRLFPEGTVPEFTTQAWYQGRERAPHWEQPAHHGRMEMALDHIMEISPVSLVDLGCGDGGLLAQLPKWISAWGYELSPEAVKGGEERGVHILQADIVDGLDTWRSEMTVATEILEHLVDPHGMVQRIAQSSPCLVASSPVDETADHHYEFHAWAWDKAGYVALMEQAGLEVVRHDVVDTFQVVTAVRS